MSIDISFEQVLTSARRLSRAERAKLITYLVEDLVTLVPLAALSEDEQVAAIEAAVTDYRTQPETFQSHDEVRIRMQAILAEQAA